MVEQDTWAGDGMGFPTKQGNGVGSSLALTFHADSCPLMWESCDLVAQFVSNYTGLFFESQPSEHWLNREEVEDAINYILIELMENALKFNIGGDIDVYLGLEDDELCFRVRNQTWPQDVERLNNIFQDIISADPADLLVRRIEENAAQPELYRSGLGFLTILNDYGASLSWSFDEGANPDYVRLTITTRFPLYRSEA